MKYNILTVLIEKAGIEVLFVIISVMAVVAVVTVLLIFWNKRRIMKQHAPFLLPDKSFRVLPIYRLLFITVLLFLRNLTVKCSVQNSPSDCTNRMLTVLLFCTRKYEPEVDNAARPLRGCILIEGLYLEIITAKKLVLDIN